MSTISIANTAAIPAGFTVPRAPRVVSGAAGRVQTRLRLTVRGRRVLAALAAAPIAAALAFGVISGGAAIASHDAGVPGGDFTTVTVMPGDSLWSIAEQYAPQADPRDVVAGIERLNGLGSSELQAGQSVAIPLEYTTAK